MKASSTDRYLVSVFEGGKNIYSCFSRDLADLVTIRAIYRTGEIHVFDLDQFETLTERQVEEEVRRSGIRWKREMENLRRMKTGKPPPPSAPSRKQERVHVWKRSVRCVETGQVFGTIRECSKATGIPYMTIFNCLKNRNATRGLHFVPVE